MPTDHCETDQMLLHSPCYAAATERISIFVGIHALCDTVVYRLFTQVSDKKAKVLVILPERRITFNEATSPLCYWTSKSKLCNHAVFILMPEFRSISKIQRNNFITRNEKNNEKNIWDVQAPPPSTHDTIHELGYWNGQQYRNFPGKVYNYLKSRPFARYSRDLKLKPAFLVPQISLALRKCPPPPSGSSLNTVVRILPITSLRLTSSNGKYRE